MKTEINQKISQLLDDELHHTKEERVLLKISKQPELLKKMNRYKTVSHALRTDTVVKINNDFLDQINQQLEKEPHYLLPKHKIKNRSAMSWQNASIAVAASVAIVSVLVSQKLNFLESPQPTVALAAVETIPQQQLLEQPNITKDQQAKEYAAMQHERLKAYLQAHSGDLYTHGSVAIHPYARVANH